MQLEVHFIEGNPNLIKTLLNRNDVLIAIVCGIIYDSKETILLILNALMKFVLESSSNKNQKSSNIQSINKKLMVLFSLFYLYSMKSFIQFDLIPYVIMKRIYLRINTKYTISNGRYFMMLLNCDRLCHVDGKFYIIIPQQKK